MKIKDNEKTVWFAIWPPNDKVDTELSILSFPSVTEKDAIPILGGCRLANRQLTANVTIQLIDI